MQTWPRCSTLGTLQTYQTCQACDPIAVSEIPALRRLLVKKTLPSSYTLPRPFMGYVCAHFSTHVARHATRVDAWCTGGAVDTMSAQASACSTKNS